MQRLSISRAWRLQEFFTSVGPNYAEDGFNLFNSGAGIVRLTGRELADQNRAAALAEWCQLAA